ncbi:MAG TPA: cytochrome P450 [Amycolatopsis sp.]|nr:cytochrome P450 [Amycolatopsis sp.]
MAETSTVARNEAVPPDSGFTQLLALDPAAVRCPFDAYASLREQGPVVWSERLNAFVVSRYSGIREVLRDPGTFSSRQASGSSSVTSLAERVLNDPEFPDDVRRQAGRRLRLSQSPVLLNADPPQHQRHRRLVSHAFTPRRVTGMEPLFQRLTDELIDGFAGRGTAELISDFALPLPMTVIATILGVPPELLATFKKWSGAFTRGVGALDLPREQISELFRSVGEFYDYFAEQLSIRSTAPADDLLTDLVEARIDGEQPLTEDEILQMLVQFLIGGNETTTNLIGSTMLHLLRDPAQLARVEADPDLVPTLVEEGLRLEAPTQGMFRTATADTEIDGHPIPRGSMVYLIFASGNRDGCEFADPDRLDLQEPRQHHLAFGRGEHVCIGANLARREAVIAIRTLLARLPGIALATEVQSLDYHPTFILRGPRRLPITFTA